jgi:citrate synthase
MMTKPQFFFSSGLLKKRVESIIPEKQKELIDIKKRFGDVVVSDVTVDQMIGGMRGVKGLFYDTSKLDAYTVRPLS